MKLYKFADRIESGRFKRPSAFVKDVFTHENKELNGLFNFPIFWLFVEI